MHYQIRQQQNDELIQNSYSQNGVQNTQNKTKLFILILMLLLLGSMYIYEASDQTKYVKINNQSDINSQQTQVKSKQINNSIVGDESDIINISVEKQVQKLKDFINKLLTKKQQSSFYNLSAMSIQKQLPFCIITQSDNPDIQKSIKNQKYSNYRLLQLNTLQPSPDTFNLTLLNNQVHSHCLQNSIILFHAHPLPDTYLSYLSKVYQTRKVWATYAATNKSVTVTSAYQRLFYLAAHNNLTGNEIRQTVISRQSLVLSVLEMGLDHLQEQSSQHMDMHSNNVLQIKYSQSKQKNTPIFDPLISMRQFSYINKEDNNFLLNQMFKNRNGRYRAQLSDVKQYQMINAIEYLQLLYLPTNHSLAQKQKNQRQNKYNLQRYSDVQKPICVFIPSFNNIQDQRYERVIKSVLQQQYQNYHIVFVDDCSTDTTLQSTMNLLKQSNFSQNKTIFIQNLKRNYATYNIVNAAFNYCLPQQIMIIVDGDDELVGRQVFKLINKVYYSKQVWMMYTTFMTNTYEYGTSKRVTRNGPNGYINSNNQRNPGHWVGQLRTFYAGLIRNIRLQDHQCMQGQWLQTVYDDSLQHPLLQLSSFHIQFLAQICYFYNKNYGNNDNSEQWKKIYRQNLYRRIIIKRQPNLPLEVLELDSEQLQVRDVLNHDYGVKFHKIKQASQIYNISDSNRQDMSQCRNYVLKLLQNQDKVSI